MTPDDPQPADQWCTYYDVTIPDPHGWIQNQIPYEASITEDEFFYLSARSKVIEGPSHRLEPTPTLHKVDL